MHTARVIRRLAPAAVVFAAVFCTATAAHAEALNTLGGAPPLVLAHRGTTGYLPEHTLGGYELAVQFGADYIEPDLQLTADGVLVAMHDDTLTRTTDAASLFAPRNGTYNVCDFTLAEVKTLTVNPVGTASTSHPGFTPSMADPFKVPTFQEVITLAKQQSVLTGREVGIYPEAKQADPAMENQILGTLIANGYDGSSKVFIQSFSIDTIRSIASKQAALGVAFKLIVLSSSSTALLNHGLDKLNGFAFGVGVSITGPGIGESFIRAAHAAKLAVHGYTFNKAAASSTAVSEYLRFYGWGIDGVFTNYADVALDARAQFLAAQVTQPQSRALLATGGSGAGGVAPPGRVGRLTALPRPG